MEENIKKYLAEAFGVFIFVFIAAGSVLANWQTGGALGVVGIALAHGFVFAAMVYAVYHISGAHLNPAVTIALWATGHVKTLAGLGYIIAQLIGSAAAALLLKVIFASASPQFFLGDTVLGSGITPAVGILIEAILTFFLVWTYFGALVDKKAFPGFGGLAVGLVFAVCMLVGLNLTMAALNPARSFGPALISSHWEMHYVYWIGPIIGGLLAGLIYHFGLGRK